MLWCFIILSLAVDGGWGQWERWSTCSATCGIGGTVSRSRVCDSPSPSNGGKECLGKKSEADDCYVIPCRKNNFLLLNLFFLKSEMADIVLHSD